MGVLERWYAEGLGREHKKELDSARYEAHRQEKRTEDARRQATESNFACQQAQGEASELRYQRDELDHHLNRALRFIEAKGLQEEFGGFE